MPPAYAADSVELADISGSSSHDAATLLTTATDEGAPRAAHEYTKHLDLKDSLSLTVGHVVGVGIFAAPAIVTAGVHDKGVSLCFWVVAGLAQWFHAACTAELGTALPHNGGPQAYILHIYGPLASFLWSWTALLLSAGPAATLLVSAEYIWRMTHSGITDSNSPNELTSPGSAIGIRIIAILLLVLMTGINCMGVRSGPRTAIVLTGIKILALATILSLALVALFSGSLASDFQQDWFAHPGSNLDKYNNAYWAAHWAYNGIDSMAFVAGEMKNPARDLPLTIHLSASKTTLLYTLTNLAYFIVLPRTLVVATDAIALVYGQETLGQFGGALFGAFIVISALGAVNSVIYMHARVIVKAAEDRQFFGYFGHIDTRHGTPIRALTFYCVHTSMFLLVGKVTLILTFGGFIFDLAALLTYIGVFIVRQRDPNRMRPYRAPFVAPAFSIFLGTLVVVTPVLSAPWTAAAGTAFLLLGIPVYMYIHKDDPPVSHDAYRHGVRRGRDAQDGYELVEGSADDK